MEVVILKAKRTRDSKLNKTRKNLKKLNQDGQEKESRTRKRATVKPSHVEEEVGTKIIYQQNTVNIDS